MSGRCRHLHIALVAVTAAVLVPAVVWVIAADTGPSEGVAVGTLLLMAAAFLAGTIASIGAIVRKERLGWVTLAATVLAPLMWFSLLVLAAILIVRISPVQ